MAAFPRQARLLTAKDYQTVFANAQRFSTQTLIVLYSPTEALQPRVGLAISKKVARLAVQRNIIKRYVREFFRQNQFHIGSYDLVFLGKPSAGQASRTEIRQSLDYLWRKLKITCGNSLPSQ
ncbi:MAG: ribonuclease P protein component [Gammaproteobacteria bacterium]|nr:ribonuclease P protein component [Gammaproteobacteria bacterium]